MTDFPIAKAQLERNPAHGGFDVHIAAAIGPDTTHVVRPLPPLEIKRATRGEYIEPKPAFTLRHDSAQHLLDALWEAGLRPSHAKNTEDSAMSARLVEALQAHVADLRRVAFDQELLEARGADEPLTIAGGTF